MTRKKQIEQELKSDFILMLLPPDKKEEIRKLCKVEDRTMSNFCLNAINFYIKKQEEISSDER